MKVVPGDLVVPTMMLLKGEPAGETIAWVSSVSAVGVVIAEATTRDALGPRTWYLVAFGRAVGWAWDERVLPAPRV